MKSPQLEDGYVRIASEIMDALARTRIPGQARQVLDYILRKTYGWGKKEDAISLSQFVKGTGLTKVSVCKSVSKLVDMRIVIKKGGSISLFTKKGNDKITVYRFNKAYSQWRTLPKKVTLLKKVKNVTQKGNQTLPKKVPTIDTITIDTITIDKPLLSGSERSRSNGLPYKQIIADLNKKTGRDYSHKSNKAQTCIKARFNEGHSLKDFFIVNTIKSKEWMGTKWAKYLRPSTLYSNKFDGYLNQGDESDLNETNQHNLKVYRDLFGDDDDE